MALLDYEQSAMARNFLLNIKLMIFASGCPRKWSDGTPYTYENWYGSDPNTYYYECTEFWTSSTYNGKWMDYTCNGAVNAFCQFYPKLTEKPGQAKPDLPPRGGCKEGWWPFAGYCYKIVGYSGNIWDKTWDWTSHFKKFIINNLI